MSEDAQMNENQPETKVVVSNKNGDKSRKRKRPFDDALTTAYSSVSFEPRKLTGECKPDSPHFFFSSSYTVKQSDAGSERKEETVPDPKDDDDARIKIQQVVHKHVNGLCMVTVGELSIPPSKTLKSFRILAKEAPSCSNAEKRKRQAKMLKGRGKVDHVVTPSTVIAELVLEDRASGEEKKMDTENPKTATIPLYACVWGTILEVNSSALTPDVLLRDPLLDGFIAIILPTGKFPPTNKASEVINSNPPVDTEQKDS